MIEDETTLEHMLARQVEVATAGTDQDRLPSSSSMGSFRWIGYGLACCDALILMCALFAIRGVTAAWWPISMSLLLTMSVQAAIWVAVFLAFGLYGSHRRSVRDEVRRTVGATATAEAERDGLPVGFQRRTQKVDALVPGHEGR
jgi:hypothetical protein